MKISRLIPGLVGVGILVGATSAQAVGPCHAMRKAKQESQKALHSCLMAWTKDVKPEQSSPVDDCSKHLQTFVESAKSLKACWSEQKAKRSGAQPTQN